MCDLWGHETHRVVDINAGIDNVGASTLTSAVIVGVSLATRPVTRDAGKTPRSIVLLGGGLDGDDSVLLDVLNLVLLASLMNSSLISLTLGSCLSFSISSSFRLAEKPLKLLE